MEDFNTYIKKFKIAIAILVAGIGLVVFLITKIVPAVQNVIQIKESIETQTTSLEDAQRKLENLKKQIEQEKQEETAAPKAIFRPITQGLDTEAAISDEFGEILQLIKENKIKARSVVYDYDPSDDKFVKNAANKYHVCRVTTELIANYVQFENFLRDLYKHEHFIDVSKIEIVPYQKNKRILLIKLVLNLYAERDPSSVAETPKAAAKENASAEPAKKAPDISEQPSPDDM